MNTTVIHALARPEVAPLPAYNAGLSSEAVRARYGVDQIARLASNENPYGASPAVARALVDLAARAGTYPDAHCTALRAAIAERSGAQPAELVIGNGSEDILQMLCQSVNTLGTLAAAAVADAAMSAPKRRGRCLHAQKLTF